MRPPTGFGLRAPTRSWLLPARPACAGSSRQSFANYRYAREGGPIKTEDDPLDPDPPASTRQTNAAMRHIDEAVTTAGGYALRYGGFYGADNDQLVKLVRRRYFPIIGDGGGVLSWIHLDDAAAADVRAALEHEGAGIYNIVDDEPAPAARVAPRAGQCGRRRTHLVAFLLARATIGGADGVTMMSEARGASNAKAKRELGWTLRYPSWRQGFGATYEPLAAGSDVSRGA